MAEDLRPKVPGPRWELREIVGPVNQVGDDGLEDGSHRQNIFLMGARVGHAETEKGWILFLNFILEASNFFVQVPSFCASLKWNLTSQLFGFTTSLQVGEQPEAEAECPANLNLNPKKMITDLNESDRPRLGPLCRQGRCSLYIPLQDKQTNVSSLVSDIIVQTLNPLPAVKIQRGTVAERSS